MKNIFIVIGLMMALLFICFSQSSACSLDTDCAAGSKCIKASGSIYGVCMGSLFPANANNSKPAYAPLSLDNARGNACAFDTECGIGNKCVKYSGNTYGVCVKK